MYELAFITPEHALYPGARALRYRVLREPFGAPPGSEYFAFEPESLHLVAHDPNGVVVACVLFHPESEAAGRLFHMAVSPALQRTGLGRRLVRALEEELGRRGVREVSLHARDTAVPFYERLGYTCVGEPFVEVGIVHRHMHRLLG